MIVRYAASRFAVRINTESVKLRPTTPNYLRCYPRNHLSVNAEPISRIYATEEIAF